MKVEGKNLSRKKKGSHNLRRQVRGLRRVYERVKDARKDFLNKVFYGISQVVRYRDRGRPERAGHGKKPSFGQVDI